MRLVARLRSSIFVICENKRLLIKSVANSQELN